jgi:glycine/D-amino acid oxidase-like deaminating enzyme
MQVDYLIIGQGISGTFFTFYLEKEKKSFLVIDNKLKNAPSRIAAGIINPVTGRRLVTVWKADEIIPFAVDAYGQIGAELGITAISQKNIIDFFPNPFMREGFVKRVEESDQYVHLYSNTDPFSSQFNFEFGAGEIRPAYIAHIESVLPAWRDRLERSGQLITDEFEINLLQVNNNGVRYKDIDAGRIIFCDGSAGVENPYFTQLPFAPNKGEALIVEIPGLSKEHIYKKSMTLAPLAAPDLFWLGSVYHWEFEDEDPTPMFRKNAEAVLEQWLKIPFRIVDHLAGIRPATLERRPFIGLHPHNALIGMINGMGTKGCSLAPYFAKQMVQHLHHNAPIDPEADIKRFTRILRTSNHK